MKEALKVLEGVPDIAICRLSASDVVRHQLVQQIVAAYEKYESKKPPVTGKTFQRKR